MQIKFALYICKANEIISETTIIIYYEQEQLHIQSIIKKLNTANDI